MLDILLEVLRKIKNISIPSFLVALFMVVTLAFYSGLPTHIYEIGMDLNISDKINLIIGISLLAVVAISAIKYLDSGNDEKYRGEISRNELKYLVSSQIKPIVEDLKTNTAARISEKEKEDLLSDLKTQFQSKLSEEHYNELKKSIKNEWLESEIDLSIKNTTNRLNNEIKTLMLRSNLNLVIGMILCFSGIIVLYLFLQKNAGMYVIAFKDHKINEIILTLIPNAFFVLLIEIFSYFFLNLYKKSIEEIKFYQNELTNLESKFLALKTAKITNNHKLQCIILEEIVKTERNFILEQGQSTIEIEKEKISSTNSSNIIKAATELLNFKK